MLRDKHGVIIQEGDDLWLSGGDSAFTTGIMALSGSTIDLFLMNKFIINGKLVRHPYQERWNKPELTSRDQVIAFFAPLHLYWTSHHSEHIYEACLGYAKSWFVNSDILMPADRYYLYKCVGHEPPKWLIPLAYVNQALSLIWDCYIKPGHEQNQSICKNAIYGKRWLKFLYRHHPRLCGNINDYFSGWRNKAELGDKLQEYVLSIVQN